LSILAHPHLRADVSAWLARQRQPELFDAAPSWLKSLCRRARRFYTRRMVHVGIGYDVHALVAGRKLILGGVEIPHVTGLDGHSDADALMHAICDAVLGALGEEDIGHFFPNTDPRWKGAPSRVFLEEAARQVALRKGRIVNVDASIIAQQPKLHPHIAEMKQRIAAALGVTTTQIGVKATTNEKLGFVGREEGIAAMAVASVDLP
jgi:2-C-methyl-D-erythritol 2,4-cyclodiphosphate synthase